jgi:hypothetical protein
MGIINNSVSKKYLITSKEICFISFVNDIFNLISSI